MKKIICVHKLLQMSTKYLEYETISEGTYLTASVFSWGKRKKESNKGLNESDNLLEIHLCKVFIDQAADFFLFMRKIR